MELKIIDNIMTLKLDMITTTALAVIFFWIGVLIKTKVKFFSQYCIPSAVIGGFLFAIIATILKSSGLALVAIDTTLQIIFQVAFFTCVGLGGSLSLLKRGGKSFIIYLLMAWFICLGQSELGVRLALLLDINPLLGIMASNVSLQGGPANAAAWGPIEEGMGATGATAVGLATAAMGMVIGGMTGGPLASWLIKKHKVKIEAAQEDSSHDEVVSIEDTEVKEKVDANSLLAMAAIILVFMAIGIKLASMFTGILGYALPGYIGAMFLAIVFRNVNDKKEIIKVNWATIDAISDFSLSLFITYAMMSIRIWDLYSLALPLIIIVVVESLFMLIAAGFMLFRFLGKDYDAAVMAAGLIGHGLGNTANAMANMDAVCRKYGVRSTKAFLIVPLTGAVLIDIAAQPIIIFYLNMWK